MDGLSALHEDRLETPFDVTVDPSVMTVNRTTCRRCAFVWAAPLAASLLWSLVPAARAEPNSPIRIGPYLHDLGPTSVEVRAVVDPPGPFELTLTKSGDAGSPRTSRSAAASLHVVRIGDLEPRTRYEYVATSGAARVQGELVTAPPDSDRSPFALLAYGDNRTDDRAHELVVRAMLAAPSDLLVHTGDYVEDSSREVEWKRFFDAEAPLLRDRCVFTAIGNHELVDSGRAYRAYFGATYSTMRWQFARFWFADAQDDSPSRWLLDELDKSDGEPGLVWRIVVLHQGPYASGPHGPNPSLTTSELDTWRKHPVDLVLSGHDHIYERGVARGLRYVVTGGAGAPSYRIVERLRTTRKTDTARHYVRLDLSPDRVKLAARRSDGSLIEEASFDKSSGWSDDPPAGAPSPDGPPAPADERDRRPWLAVLGVAVTALLLGTLWRRYRR